MSAELALASSAARRAGVDLGIDFLLGRRGTRRSGWGGAFARPVDSGSLTRPDLAHTARTTTVDAFELTAEDKVLLAEPPSRGSFRASYRTRRPAA